MGVRRGLRWGLWHEFCWGGAGVRGLGELNVGFDVVPVDQQVDVGGILDLVAPVDVLAARLVANGAEDFLPDRILRTAGVVEVYASIDGENDDFSCATHGGSDNLYEPGGSDVNAAGAPVDKT